MNKNTLALALLSLASLCASCGQNPASSIETTSYEVTILNKHAKPVENVEVEIGGVKATTGEDGKVTIEAAKGEHNVLTPTLPSGYINPGNFSVSDGGSYSFTLDSTLQEKVSARDAHIGIGDLAYNYSYTTYKYNESGEIVSEEITLKDKLQGKDFLCLNFFYFDCTWCQTEAPWISLAYSKYSSKGYMIGLDMIDLGGKNSALCDFKADEGLNFDVAYDESRLTNVFEIRTYPTTVIVDRYGFVCFYYADAFVKEGVLEPVFESFSGENYEPIFYKKNSLTIDN